MRGRLFPILALILIGVSWAFTQPLAKIAVSTGHKHFGLIFWQLIISVIILGAIQIMRRRPFTMTRTTLFFYAVIAIIGTIVPNSASYQAVVHLPAGLMSILLSLIPMFAFPLAVILGNDRFSWQSLLGLLIGLFAVVLIVGVPEALPVGTVLLFIPLAMVAPFCYACEENFVAKFGTGGTGPVELLLGASIVGTILILPLTIASGQFISPFRPYGVAEYSLIAASAIHAVVYACFVALIRAYGATFAAQVSYVVTGSGVLWAIWLLDESYGGPVWWALGLMLIGVYLVRPKSQNSDHASPD